MQVCFRLTYYHGRVGLAPVDAVVGHNLAALSAGAAPKEAAPKKAKHRPGKRKAPGRAAGGGKGSRAGQWGMPCRVLVVPSEHCCELRSCDEAGEPRRGSCLLCTL